MIPYFTKLCNFIFNKRYLLRIFMTMPYIETIAVYQLISPFRYIIIVIYRIVFSCTRIIVIPRPVNCLSAINYILIL